VRLLRIMLFGVLVGAAIVAPSASAKVAGPNGRIVFGREDFAHDLTIVYTANPDGSHVKRLLPAGIGAGSPHWSPDGSRIAVGSALDTPCCDIFPYSAVIVNPDTGAYRTLPMQSGRVTTFCTIWSPNARRLACEGFNDNDSSPNGVYTIRSSDGGDLTRITNSGGGSDIPIDYSPDGTRILYAHSVGEDDPQAALWMVDVDGTHKHQLTPNGFFDDDGSWSPDGRWIAFEHNGSLVAIHPNGTRLHTIRLKACRLVGAGDVVWSPNGRKITFLLVTKTGPGSFREGIATANADGSNVHWVTTSPSFDHQTDWGPHPRIR